MITMGMDPGTRNFACVVLDARERVSMACMLHSTVVSMSRDRAADRPRFRAMIRRLLRYARPDELMIEAFVSRGFGVQLTEVVNIMIGSIMSECDHLHVVENVTQASSWKNSVGQHYRWPDFVEPGRRGRRSSKKITPVARGKAACEHMYKRAVALDVPVHVVDALLLATYLRHGKSMERVDWTHVHANIRRLGRLLPTYDRTSNTRERNRTARRGQTKKRRTVRGAGKAK